MRVWVDIVTPGQSHLFHSLIPELGERVSYISSTDFAETNRLLEKFGVKSDVIGRHLEQKAGLMNVQGARRSRVVIGDDVWIGARVIILPGRKIGKGSVIGAGSLVTMDVPEYSIVGSDPARVLKSRLSEEGVAGSGETTGKGVFPFTVDKGNIQ
jgi:acetyltransferase-like isoleucine patch superfamily enzyme